VIRMDARACLLSALALLAPAPAAAGVLSTMTGASAPAGAERRYDTVTLRPADLKSCLVDVYSIDVADALFDSQRPAVEQEREELRKLRDAAGAKPSTETAAVAAELRARAQAFNARVAMLNSRVAYAQEARDRFSRNCKGRRYYFEDLHLVRDELPREIREAIPKPQ